MSFTRPLFLLLILLLPYVVYVGWPRARYGRRRARVALGLRVLIVLLLVLSLAGVQTTHGGDALSVVFLLDVSDSISAPERARAEAFVDRALATMAPDDRAALVLFGADALVERPMMGGGDLGQIASIPRTDQTDLEGAVRTGMALFPAGAARRMVILSDGRPTLGNAEQAVRLARSQGVQVDVVVLTATPTIGEPGGVETWLTELTAPDRLHQGEEFSLSVTARAAGDTEATLTVLAGDEAVAQQVVHLNPGANTFAVPLTAGEPGFVRFRAYLSAPSDIYPQNNVLSAYAMVEGPPRVLAIAEEEAALHLRGALEAAGLAVERVPPGGAPVDPTALADYAAVALVDAPAQALSPQAMAALQTYVRDLGGGLVAIGGPRAYGVGGWYETPLEETLPVEMTIHDQERFPPMAIVIVIDKSGSMAAVEGGVQKIRLAGEAAARVAELITDLDEITVIAFDDRPADVIGPLLGTERSTVIDQVTRLQAGGGGIYVRESLERAVEILGDSEQEVRHIILLADGSDSEHQQGVPGLVADMVGQGITLSTVAIGAGQDLAFLEQIAEQGGGRYYFTDRAATLPVIFAEETQLAMRSYIVEEPFYPQQTGSSPILTGIEEVPQLAGYVATSPKSAGRVILATHQEDPLLAAWQYGLGRSVAWTSDATGRWAQAWVGWEGFSRFWAQAVRWTILQRSDVPVEVNVTLEGREAQVTVDAVADDGSFINGLDADLSVVGPEGEPLALGLAQTAPGRYQGTFEPQTEGAYLMRLAGSLGGEEALAMTTGWVKGYSPEYAALEGDPNYLAGLAEQGGGALLAEPAEAVAHNLPGRGVRRELWPTLLAMAALLLPVDIAVRRLVMSRRDLARVWVWLGDRLGRYLPQRGPRAGETGEPEPSSPVDRLFEAKARSRTQRPEGAPPEREPELPAEPVPPPAQKGDPTPEPEAAEAPAEEEGTLAARLLRRRRDDD